MTHVDFVVKISRAFYSSNAITYYLRITSNRYITEMKKNRQWNFCSMDC